MAFDEMIARINLFLTQMENNPRDAHEMLEQIHLELNHLKATGQPLPDDLLRLEKQLENEFSKPVDAPES